MAHRSSRVARALVLGVAVAASIATAPTETLSVADFAAETIELDEEQRAVERIVRVTVTQPVVDAAGGFVPSLRVRVDGTSIVTLFDGEAPATVPGSPADTLELELSELGSDVLTQEVLVTIGVDPFAAQAPPPPPVSVTLDAEAIVSFPGLDNGGVVTEPDALPAGAAVTVELVVVEPADGDGDGLSDAEERVLATDPLAADTDGDGLGDADELPAGADPLVQDSDGDGLLDGDEVQRGTRADDDDTDDDGESDGTEVECGSSPLDPALTCAAPPPAP